MANSVKSVVQYLSSWMVPTILGLCIFLVIQSVFIEPSRIRGYSQNPFAPIENIQVRRASEGVIVVDVDITKNLHCEVAPLGDINWIWRSQRGALISTSDVLIKGRKINLKNTIAPGSTVRVKGLEAIEDEKVLEFSASNPTQDIKLSLGVSCDRGDGIVRTFELKPSIVIQEIRKHHAR